ncbi:hypothetical protein BDK51DRAFT_28943 [Blyttiomyces helicus]|uniref:IGFBP N-terminal domain-containing protein n=1 Tax=Blyttiomyces helicus TaxID=388810 RepID=A0A4P9WL97_9FUNG|nr:hypothetical protein BDK51DRAFT_28943 [Blyttiomyces helicus]|eukprot:RKO92368.1 hypothetical protein BDK51DRAFT_28943 [Blyttiomyces helicus]
MHVIRSIAVAAFVVAVIADPAPSTYISAPVGKGHACGGNHLPVSTCEYGLVCKHKTTGPLIAGAPGICTARTVGKGESCGGNILNPPECESGLTCKLSVSHPDTGGVCVATSKIVGLGEHCGGFIANPNECKKGLHCKVGKIPDLGGICVA